MGSAWNQTVIRKVVESLPSESLKLESHFIPMLRQVDYDLLRYIYPGYAFLALNTHIWGVA